MKNIRTQITTNLLLGALTLGLVACSNSGEESKATDNTVPSQTIAGLFVDDAPPNPIPVATLLQDTQPGNPVSVVGQIGGVLSPFADEYAVFFLTDEAVVFCDEMGDDHCPTPWDACCEDPDLLKKSRILVQFTNESGEILPVGLKGANDLTELDKIVVSGTVESADGEGFMIEGKSIHLAPQE